MGEKRPTTRAEWDREINRSAQQTPPPAPVRNDRPGWVTWVLTILLIIVTVAIVLEITNVINLL
jgi:hypothetical protein